MIVKDNESTYHSNPALSNSRITQLLRCPAFYKWQLDHPVEKDSPTLLLGKLFHAMVLEPETVPEKYAMKRYNGSTRDGRAEKRDADAKGLALVSQEIWETAAGMAKVVNSSQIWLAAQSDRENFATETSIYWTQNDNIACKARLDCIANLGVFGRYIIDLKSTTSSDPDSIKSSMVTYGYHRQAAWYRHALAQEGFTTKGFIFLFVEKEPPFIMTPVRISENAQANALEELKTALDIYQQCQDTGIWPTYTGDQIIDADLPEWYYRQQGGVINV